MRYPTRCTRMSVNDVNSFVSNQVDEKRNILDSLRIGALAYGLLDENTLDWDGECVGDKVDSMSSLQLFCCERCCVDFCPGDFELGKDVKDIQRKIGRL